MNRLCALISSVVFISCSFAQQLLPSGATAAKLNNNGDIGGSYQNLPVIFHNDGTITHLQLLPNTTLGFVVDINDSGACIGYLRNTTGPQTGVFWDANGIPSISMSPANELPKALNNSNQIVYGPFMNFINNNGCFGGQLPYPDSRPTVWCNGSFEILPNAPRLSNNGSYVNAKDDSDTWYGVNVNYQGTFRATRNENGTFDWTNFGNGYIHGISIAATLDHSDLFGYEGIVGSRMGVVWHPIVHLYDEQGHEHLHYGENVYFANTLEIVDSSSGNASLGIPALRLVRKTNNRFETIPVRKAADINGDGFVNNFDIDPFIGSLGFIAPNKPGFPGTQLFPDFPRPAQYTDFNADGYVNFLDVDYFVNELLSNN